MLLMKLHARADDFEQRRTKTLDSFLAGSWKEQIQHFVKIKPKLPPRLPVPNQVRLSEDYLITEAQRANADIQHLIHLGLNSSLTNFILPAGSSKMYIKTIEHLE